MTGQASIQWMKVHNRHYTYNFVSQAIKIWSNWAHFLENDTWKSEKDQGT